MSEKDDSIKISKSLILPISIMLSTLILSGTIFLVGANLNNGLGGLTIAGNLQETTKEEDSKPAALAPPSPAPSPSPLPTQPSGGPVDMASLIEGANLLHGNPEAPVQIIEFSDFECPFCGRSFPTVQALIEKYGDDIAIYYKHFPLSFHPNAKPAALASECAAEQGKFKEFHDKLFENQQAIDSSSLKQHAADLGLDTTKFNECFDSSKYNQKVEDEFALGSQSGVSGTPTFFINGQKLVGAQPQISFEAIIDPILS